MDPDANWREQQEIKRRISKRTEERGDRARLRELQSALREWLARGGFAPRGYKTRKPSSRKLAGESRDEYAGRLYSMGFTREQVYKKVYGH